MTGAVEQPLFAKPSRTPAGERSGQRADRPAVKLLLDLLHAHGPAEVFRGNHERLRAARLRDRGFEMRTEQLQLEWLDNLRTALQEGQHLAKSLRRVLERRR